VVEPLVHTARPGRGPRRADETSAGSRTPPGTAGPGHQSSACPDRAVTPRNIAAVHTS
jgi:hypothetical protein